MAQADLRYRGYRDDRLTCFEYKQEANFLLLERVQRCMDEAEYEVLRQEWGEVNRPRYRDLTWSLEQLEVLERIDAALALDDEEAQQGCKRWLYVEGPPGSGQILCDPGGGHQGSQGWYSRLHRMPHGDAGVFLQGAASGD